MSAESDTSDNATALVGQACRWETGARAYSAQVELDLLGDLVLRCTNAGVGKRHYQERVLAVGLTHVRNALSQLGQRRRGRGYALVWQSESGKLARGVVNDG